MFVAAQACHGLIAERRGARDRENQYPEQEYTLADLAERLRIPQSMVSGEVRRLTDAGILAAEVRRCQIRRRGGGPR